MRHVRGDGSSGGARCLQKTHFDRSVAGSGNLPLIRVGNKWGLVPFARMGVASKPISSEWEAVTPMF